jgi:hypothetical protein
MVYEDADATLLRLYESFMESAPQLGNNWTPWPDFGPQATVTRLVSVYNICA